MVDTIAKKTKFEQHKEDVAKQKVVNGKRIEKKQKQPHAYKMKHKTEEKREF